MATVSPHTHEFTIETATTADIIEGVDDTKAVTPAGIKPVFDALGGDMTAAVYDPNGVASDAFSMDSMAEGADTKILTAIERALLSNIAVTQPVDLDAMETKLAGIEASADVTDAANIASSINGTSAKSPPVDADLIPLIDSEASNALKKMRIDVLVAKAKAAYDLAYAAISHTHTFASLTSKPTTLSGYGITDAQAFDAFLDDIADLTDPGADRLLFWDDSDSIVDWLTLGTNLSISGKTLNATGGGGGGGGDMYIATYDPTGKNSDAFLMSNMVEDTNAKIMTAAERTKLSGIETSADVTDAGNVGSSIHGATAKTTPVSADTFALIDSAASNVLKKVTWANILTTITTAADALYQPLATILTNIAGLSSTGLIARTGSGAVSVRTISSGTGITVTNGDGVAGNPSVAISDAELLALAGLTSAADAMPYFTGSGTASVTTLTSFMRTVLDDADAATARTTLDAEKLGEKAGINTQTGTTYTLALTDKGKAVEMNNASPNTLTVPPNSDVAFPTTTQIDIAQYGAGQTTIAAGSGVTIRSSGGKLKLTGQYSGATLYKRGTNEWMLFGDIAA